MPELGKDPIVGKWDIIATVVLASVTRGYKVVAGPGWRNW
jgi:hypothetical protein